MTFEEFIHCMKEEMIRRCGDQAEIGITQGEKNNNRKVTGIHIRKYGSIVAPVFYLEDYYNYYKEGKTIEAIGGILEREYELAYRRVPETLVHMKDYEYNKERIIYQLINYDRNRQLLMKCPHVRLFDLAVVFRVVVHYEEHGMYSTLITEELMDYWGTCCEDLLLHARVNTQSLFPPRLCMIDDLLEEAGLDRQDSREDFIEMYILTNQIKINGAATILYDNVLADFAREHQSDFYILPSSIHEVILLPGKYSGSVRILFRIVEEVNRTIINSDDILSDRVYYYKWKEHKLEALSIAGETL